MASNN
jgi:hypothetical protein